ncbi:MAG TPA: hypothetical protein VGI39_18350 [Polyangiaceae bacterium]
MKRNLAALCTFLVSGSLVSACSDGKSAAGTDAGTTDSGAIDAGTTDAGSGAGDSGAGLQWYTTCGSPVCQVGDGGVQPPGQGCAAVGSSCSHAGDTCGTATQQNCGVTLVCASQDPKAGVGGCPISTRAYKDGIRYVDDSRLLELHDEALALKLATYTYKPQVADPTPKHLGFIIEDNLASPAVDPAHSRVDMYGYVSLVVAGMQVQEKEIAQLRAELDDARREMAACKGARAGE